MRAFFMDFSGEQCAAQQCKSSFQQRISCPPVLPVHVNWRTDSEAVRIKAPKETFRTRYGSASRRSRDQIRGIARPMSVVPREGARSSNS